MLFSKLPKNVYFRCWSLITFLWGGAAGCFSFQDSKWWDPGKGFFSKEDAQSRKDGIHKKPISFISRSCRLGFKFRSDITN